MSSINNIPSSYLQSIFNSALQSAGVTSNNSSTSSITSSSLSALSDNSNMSPFAQLASTLQQLQQSDPTKYQQVTQQIATNLQSAAQTAQSDGNTTLAGQLNKLSSDFTNASTSGQLPNLQDLAKAIGGHHHGHHAHGPRPASDADGDSSTNDSSITSSAGAASSGSQTISQLFTAFQANSSQSNALNPLNIILN